MSADTATPQHRLHQSLSTCSTAITSGDFKTSDEAVVELAELLNSVAVDAASEPDNEALSSNAYDILVEIHRYVASPSLEQLQYPCDNNRIMTFSDNAVLSEVAYDILVEILQYVTSPSLDQLGHSRQTICTVTFEKVAVDAVSEPDNEALSSNAYDIIVEIHRYVALPSLEQALSEVAYDILVEILRYVTSPSLDQAVVDALSFELPKAVARFACLSQRCAEIAETVINRFIEMCNPRDMLSVLCEALDSPGMMFKAPCYYAPLLTGVSKVLILIQRRPFEQLKEAVPIIVNVLKTASSKSDEEETNCEDLLKRSIDIASSIQLLHSKSEGNVKEKLRALLGLYVLQIMAFALFGTNFKISSRLSFLQQLSDFLRYCDMSYMGLITGHDVETLLSTLVGDYGDEGLSCFSYTKHGAALAVIWAYKSHEIPEATGDDIAAVITEVSSNRTKRWKALDMLRNILTSFSFSWELKKQAIDFLLGVFDGNILSGSNNEEVECASFLTSLFSALQAVEMVIIYAPDPVIKRNAFDAFKKVLADIPTSDRFDTLMALINNSDSSSMIAILIDCVRNELRMENSQQKTGNQAIHIEDNVNQSASFWNAGILELVALVLRPAKGGPPSLPEFGDAVLSALNLYRYVLMTESIGNTNCTGVLTRENLHKAYNEWLLPLRTLVTGIMAENKKDSDDLTLEIVCGLNPIELVLYRCIELVEEKLQNTS